MKILFITNGITGSGGLERTLSLRTTYFIERWGWEVHISVGNEPSKKPKFFTYHEKVCLHELNYNSLFDFFSKIRKLVQSLQPDIVSVCDDGFKGFFIPWVIPPKIPVIYERHASRMLNFQKTLRGDFLFLLARWSAKKFKKFVVLSPSNINEWKLKNAVVIPNPIPFNVEHPSSLNHKRIICVSKHSFAKGTDLLLDVWKMVSEKHQEWELHFYGKIDEDRRFIQQSEALGLKNIFFHEPIQNIETAYLQSDIKVLPSRSEGFGMVLIEAMACGVPCVAFDCPSGPGDIITHGVDGFLVPPEDTKSMADYICQLIENEELRKQMGANALKKSKNYQLDEVMKQWKELYESLKPANNLQYKV